MNVSMRRSYVDTRIGQLLGELRLEGIDRDWAGVYNDDRGHIRIHYFV